MTNTNDKPSQRSGANPDLDLATRQAAQDRRVNARVPQRIIIRTAENRFDVPLDEIPAGMTYEWKVKTVLGKPAREQMIAWRLNGWKEVPAGRHPSFSGEPESSQAEIERGGLVLCERPEETTEYARDMDRAKAKDQVQAQLDRLAGRARDTGSQRVTKVKGNYEPIVD